MTQRTLIFLAGLLWAAGASAQTTRVRGQVTDAADGKPLQFVSVVFPGTTTGITTDEQIRVIAEKSCVEGESIHNMVADVTPDQLYAAIITADALGKEALAR